MSDVRRRVGSLAAILVIGLVAAGAVGCKEQQLSENNVALQKQLEKALSDNAEMKGQLETLSAQNQELQGDLDKSKGPGTMPPGPAGRNPRTKPEFGEGTEVRMHGEMMTVTLHDEVLFAPGSADLKPGSKKLLDKVASVLTGEYKGYSIRVEGHTDSTPIRKTKEKWDDNWELSCNRALAVVRYLTQKGVEDGRIYAAGFGSVRPVAANTSVAGRAKNRRVEIVVWPKK
jgi:chemotaxis protein MotB